MTSSHCKCQLESSLPCLLLLNFLFILLFIIQQGDCGVWLWGCTVCLKNAVQGRALLFPFCLAHYPNPHQGLLATDTSSLLWEPSRCTAIIFRFNGSTELSEISFKRCKENKIQTSHYFSIKIFFLYCSQHIFVFSDVCWVAFYFLISKPNFAFFPWWLSLPLAIRWECCINFVLVLNKLCKIVCNHYLRPW